MESFIASLAQPSIPHWDALPDLDLYMDQVIAFMEKYLSLFGDSRDKLITPSMINNYVKLGVLPPPVKKKYNQLMLDMEASLEETIRNSEDPLETALLYARIGNYIDFAALSNVNSDTVLSLLKEDNKEPLNAQEYLHFRKDLSAASRLVYLTDNCGEIVLDKLVIILLKELCPELDITVIVRGFPVINDATMEDAQDIGLAELTTVIGNGSEVGGTWLPHISSEAREALESADLIIAKGQGNYETLHDCGLNIYYLFLCKCKWFQYQFNAKPLQGMFINERRI